MTSMVHSDLPYASERNSHEFVTPYSGSLRGATKNQPKARTLKQTSGSPSSLLLLSALIFLVAQCALYLKTYRYSGDSSRRLSDRRSHRSSLNKTPFPSSTGHQGFQFTSLEDACNHQAQSSNGAAEIVESGLQSPSTDDLPTYDEACRSPPQDSNSFVQSPRSQNPAEGPDPLPSYEEACGSQGQSSGGNTQSWRSPHAAVGQAALPSYEEACGNQASSNDGNEQNGRNRGAVAEAASAASDNASAARGGLRGVFSNAWRTIACAFRFYSRNSEGHGTGDESQSSVPFEFPALENERDTPVLKSVVQFIQTFSSRRPREREREFQALLMGVAFGIRVVLERHRPNWPTMELLLEFTRTLETCVLDALIQLSESSSRRKTAPTIEITSTRDGNLVGHIMVQVTALRAPPYNDTPEVECFSQTSE